jgi:hypothetical protein
LNPSGIDEPPIASIGLLLFLLCGCAFVLRHPLVQEREVGDLLEVLSES